MASRTSKTKQLIQRYGIGEWFGKSFVKMSPEERRETAQSLSGRGAKRLCTWRSASGKEFRCNKKGGVCSLRLYQKDNATGRVSVAPEGQGRLCTTCPERFYQDGAIFAWIGEMLLDAAEPVVLSQIGFLESEGHGDDAPDDREGVGKIDHVLVHPQLEPLRWCALEMQAVYFSGDKMALDFNDILQHEGTGLPFPQGQRHPDFRSSGPKRLMPQLQIKVPALRRWGKKMAVVVDEAFYKAMGRMDDVPDVSNSDIAWFVVRYDESGEVAKLARSRCHLTTLERAVEGLTSGRPVSLAKFEERIRRKLAR